MKLIPHSIQSQSLQSPQLIIAQIPYHRILFVMSNLLEPITIGGKLPLRNRIVMGSMTRNRCIDDNKPGPAQIKHYADRAKYGTGLIVTEGTFVVLATCLTSSFVTVNLTRTCPICFTELNYVFTHVLGFINSQ